MDGGPKVGRTSVRHFSDREKSNKIKKSLFLGFAYLVEPELEGVDNNFARRGQYLAS